MDELKKIVEVNGRLYFDDEGLDRTPVPPEIGIIDAVFWVEWPHQYNPPTELVIRETLLARRHRMARQVVGYIFAARKGVSDGRARYNWQVKLCGKPSMF